MLRKFVSPARVYMWTTTIIYNETHFSDSLFQKSLADVIAFGCPDWPFCLWQMNDIANVIAMNNIANVIAIATTALRLRWL